jgi:hypothetical protein
MLVVFGIGTVIIKRAQGDHWLANDHILTIIASVLGLVGAVLQVKFAGGSWAGVLAAGMAAVMLILQKPQAAQVAPVVK